MIETKIVTSETRMKKINFNILLILFGMCFLWLFINIFYYHVYALLRAESFVVYGQSMSPTLKEGDSVLGTKVFSSVSHGDIVIFNSGDGTRIVKSVVATSGDRILVSADLRLQVQLKGEQSLRVICLLNDPLPDMPNSFVLKDNQVFVIGDNQNATISLILNQDDIQYKVLGLQSKYIKAFL